MKKTIIALSIATIACGSIYLLDNKDDIQKVEYKKAETKNIKIKENIEQEINKEIRSTDIKKDVVRLEIKKRIDNINQNQKEKEKNLNSSIKIEDKNAQEIEKIINGIEYTDFDNKRVSPFTNINEVSWNIEDNEYLKNKANYYNMDLYNENIIERISIKNPNALFKAADKGFLKELEMPSNGKNYTYNNCEGSYSLSYILCSDPKGMGSLKILKLDDGTIEIKHKNEYGKFYGALKENEGYFIDVTETEVIFLHD